MEENRYNSMLAGLPANIRIQLDQIRRFVEADNACAFVGSGFSRNAVSETGAEMSDWAGLRKVFYERLGGKADWMEGKSQIELASLIESTFGHHELNNLIYSTLPDNEVRPGSLHHAMMSVRWRDVLTTNYDTLLERTAKDVPRNYQVVTTKETLLYSHSPRIIKLHGSFKDIRPFVMSEEDFRTYPQKHPEFINTVRQIFIENLICLIGFSGNDPNFLNWWLGWTRDVMGEEMNPVYLITHSDELSLPYISQMRSRKIEVINLKDAGAADMAEGLAFFFKYISTPARQEEWDCTVDFRRDSVRTPVTAERVRELTERMSAVRTSFPGWVVLPVRYHDGFSDTVENFPFMDRYISGEIPAEDRIRFLYEVDWRMNTACSPEKMDWFVEAVESLAGQTAELPKETAMMAARLNVSLLRIYRMDMDSGAFGRTERKLAGMEEADAFRDEIRYESCMMAFCSLDFEKLRNLLAEWKVADGNYRSVLWKSCILAMTGKREEAYGLVSRAMNAITQKSYSSGLTGYEQSVRHILYSAMRLYAGRFGEPVPAFPETAASGDMLRTVYRKVIEDYGKPVRENGQSRRHNFRINSIVREWHFGASGYQKKYVYSYRLFAIKEAAGIPHGMESLTVDADNMKLLLPDLWRYWRNFAWSITLRSFNQDAVDKCVDREVLGSFSRNEAESLYDTLMPFCKMEDKREAFEAALAKKVLLPFLSRLCALMDKEKICDVVRTVIAARDSGRMDITNALLLDIYPMLDAESVGKIAGDVLEVPIEPDSFGGGIELPDPAETAYALSDKAFSIVSGGISDEDEKISSMAYDRICFIMRNSGLDPGKKERLSQLVTSWRNRGDRTVEKIYSYNLVKPSSQEGPVFVEVVESLVRKFVSGDYRIEKSSAPLSSFSDNLEELNIHACSLTSEQVAEAVGTAVGFLGDNADAMDRLYVNRQPDWISFENIIGRAFIALHVFLRNTGCNMDKGAAGRLRDVLSRYVRKGYPCTGSYILSDMMAGKDEDGGETVDLDRLMSGLASEDAYLRWDAASALPVFCRKNAEGLFDRLSAFMTLLYDNRIGSVLHAVRAIINDGLATPSDVNKIVKAMGGIYERRMELPGTAEEYTDLLYEMMVMAGFISRIGALPEREKEILGKWESLLSDPTVFNDVKNGYELGRRLYAGEGDRGTGEDVTEYSL